MKHKCPQCGNDRFSVTAHVTQDWDVDSEGDFLCCTTECEEVIHRPDDSDLWTCTKCGYSSSGSDFVTGDSNVSQLNDNSSNTTPGTHKVLIGRPINGISVNGLEYVCDEGGISLVFSGEKEALEFLSAHGISEEEIDNSGIVFVNASTAY